MGKFLDLFPKIRYTLDSEQYSDYQTITNLTFRIGVIQNALNNVAAYTLYTIKDGDTPENLANKFYGDPQTHWLILYANNIMDPQYDWPLNGTDFAKYITDKYGSEAIAETTIHHYEKVITRENTTDNVITVTRFQINQANAAASMATSLPYDTYNSLAASSYVAQNIVGGKTVIETISRNAVTNYDWEFAQNEAKRNIKVIKVEYMGQIMREFDNLTNNARNATLRRLV